MRSARGPTMSTTVDPLRNALASATRCFSPPLSFSPRSPTLVLYPPRTGRNAETTRGHGHGRGRGRG